MCQKTGTAPSERSGTGTGLEQLTSSELHVPSEQFTCLEMPGIPALLSSERFTRHAKMIPAVPVERIGR
ncbi:hypothetical protein J6590_012058 [Homalodisca vitripennis]|nr:hypothetical protein J6590_012058 [Homalodisca vitripennis]